MNRPLLRVACPCLMASSFAVISCQEETLTRLTPTISICPGPDVAQAQCDRAIDLGEVPVNTEVPITLYLREIGGATVDVTSVRSSDPFVTVGEAPSEVLAGREVPLPLTLSLPEEALGPRQVVVTLETSDPNRPVVETSLILEAVPKFAPEIVICLGAQEPDRCEVDLDVDIGVVRRAQSETIELAVHNLGTAPLAIEEVSLEGQASIAGEIVIVTSTRPGELPAGAQAPLVLVYEPRDAGVDEVTIVIASNDELSPRATVRVRAAAEQNLPPDVVAFVAASGESTASALVDDLVQLDGSGSSDPEGDPLRFSWQLSAPPESAAALDDTSAVRASFVPDVPGVYSASLRVRDSLEQESVAMLSVTVAARFAVRAVLEWSGSADVDLHVIEAGSALFSPRDCHFANRDVNFGAPGVATDDCVLIDDAVISPGPEQAGIVAPASGTFEVWAHVFDLTGGNVDVTARVVLDDAATAALELGSGLSTDCAAWHVADITVAAPGAAPTITPIDSIDVVCP